MKTQKWVLIIIYCSIQYVRKNLWYFYDIQVSLTILVATGSSCSLQKLIERAIIVCLNSHLYCLFEPLSAYFSGYDGQFAFADIGQGTVTNLIYCD